MTRKYLDLDDLFSGMRASIDKMLGAKPKPPIVERDERRDENGARVVQIRASDGVKTKDSAG